MRRLSLGIFILACTGILIQCRSSATPISLRSTPTASSQTPKNLSPEVEEKYEQSVQAVRENKSLSLTEEYQSFQTAVSDYKKSEAYKNPKDDAEKLRKEMVDASSHLTLEDVKKNMKEGKFTRARQRIKNKLPEIQKTADKIFEIKRDTSSEMHLAEGKTETQQGSGIALIVFGSLGALNAIASKSLLRLAFAAWPLTVGALIVANDEPNSDAIKAAQGYIGTGAAVLGLAAIGLGAVAAHGLWVSAGHSFDSEKTIKFMGKDANAGDVKAGSVVSAGLAILAAGVTAGLAVWAAEMDLSESTMSPQDVLYSKIERAFIAFETIEAEKKF